MQTQGIKNKYDTRGEFETWARGIAAKMDENFRRSVAACARATGNFPSAENEGYNPRIFCGECVSSLFEK